MAKSDENLDIATEPTDDKEHLLELDMLPAGNSDNETTSLGLDVLPVENSDIETTYNRHQTESMQNIDKEQSFTTDPSKNEKHNEIGKENVEDNKTFETKFQKELMIGDCNIQNARNANADELKEFEDIPISKCFSNWDDVADIPTIHFSFLINLLFPKHVVSWKISKAQQEVDRINQRRRVELGRDIGGTSVPVGSVAECYQMPKIIEKSGIPTGQNLSDTDILMVWDTSPIKELDETASAKQKLILETDGIHPGYARILINDPKAVLRNVEPDFAILLNDKYYLSARKQRENAEKNARIEAMLSKIPLMVEQTGPATAMENTTSRSLQFFKEHKKVQDRQELVPAIKCIWPSQASNWIRRTRNNGWINPTLAESIVENGCHVVPVPHRLSNCSDVEWRISFATSEVQLAKDAVTDDQRQCYLYFKLLGNIIMKETKLISSYHMKTTFLHACEKLPLNLWRENAGHCVLYLLDSLLTYVRNRWLPSFFVPENNLIDHLTDSEYQTLESLLQAARMNPIEPILEFTDTHVISNQSVVASFRNNISALLGDFEKFKAHRTIQTALPNFISALNGIVVSILIDNKASEAVAYLVDSFNFLKMYSTEDRIDKFIYTSLVNWKLVIQLVQVYENVLTYADEYPELINLSAYLACLFHAASFNFIPGSSSCTEALEKSEKLMKSILEEKETMPPATVDYAFLLLTQQKLQDAVDVLRKYVQEGNYDSTDMNTYDSVTCITLNESLKMEVRQIVNKTMLVSFPSLSLAYYLILNIFQDNGQKDELQSTIQKFENHCHRKSDKWSFYLLGIALMDLEIWDKAETAFSEVLKLDSTHFSSKIKMVITRVNKLITDGNITEAFQFLVEFSEKYYPKIPVPRSIGNIALQLQKPSFSVQLYEEMSSNFPENLTGRGNIACMYYAQSMLHCVGTEDHLTALVKADTLFYTCAVAESSGFQSAVTIDYASFLCGQNRWFEAKELLERFLYQDKMAVCRNNYGSLEFNCLDDNLKKEVRIQGSIEADSVSFAYYFLVKCLIEINKSNAEKVISQFKQECFKHKNHVGFSLLGYCNIMVENWGEAEHCFCKAVEFKWDYTAAKQNIASCRQNMIWKRDLRYRYSPLCIIPELLGDFTLDFDKISSF